MKNEEKVVRDYLVDLGFENIVYEPEGKGRFPDFLADGRVAVEARRLNQNERNGSEFHGLEEDAVPLQMSIRKLLAALGPPRSGASWVVKYALKRPLPARKPLISKLRRYLEAFRDDQRQEPTSFSIGESLNIKVFRASDRLPTFFVFGGYSDKNSGGFILAETKKNLRICIDEKTPQMVALRYKYPEWWLVLIDRIGYGIEACDRELFAQNLKLEHGWDKVILLSPLDPTCAFEIPRSQRRGIDL